MADQENGFVEGHYLSRSWALLTRDRGWIKPVLVLSLVALVPIIGPMAVLGYALEWARLTAWGVDAAPKQKHVDVGQVLASGWRGFVVAFVWEGVITLAYALLCWLIGYVPGESEATVASNLLSAVYTVASLLLVVTVLVAQIRAIIYQKIGAGLRVRRVFEMVSHDFGGLLHMLGMQILGWFVEFCEAIVFVIITAAIVFPYVMGFSSSSASLLPGSNALGSYIAGALGSLAVPIVLFVFVLSLTLQVTMLLMATGVALWMRQFDVSRWGKSTDPLPGPVTKVDSASSDGVGGSGEPSQTPDDDAPANAPATRTTTTIVRVPGEAPKIETKTEVIADRGVIHQGPASNGETDGRSDLPPEPKH